MTELRDGAIEAMAKAADKEPWNDTTVMLDALLDYLKEHEHEWSDAADEIPNASDVGGLIEVLRKQEPSRQPATSHKLRSDRP